MGQLASDLLVINCREGEWRFSCPPPCKEDAKGGVKKMRMRGFLGDSERVVFWPARVEA